MAELSSLKFAALVAVAASTAFAGIVAVGLLPATIEASASAALASGGSAGIVRSFPLCSGAVRTTCVVDGDTIWLDGVKIRIADIDTPEIGQSGCESERELGHRAKARLRALIDQRPFALRAWPDRDEDRHGRKLRVLIRDGKSIGDQLVAEGLARTWSGRREPWC